MAVCDHEGERARSNMLRPNAGQRAVIMKTQYGLKLTYSGLREAWSRVNSLFISAAAR